jgi:hypothetical protein
MSFEFKPSRFKAGLLAVHDSKLVALRWNYEV